MKTMERIDACVIYGLALLLAIAISAMYMSGCSSSYSAPASTSAVSDTASTIASSGQANDAETKENEAVFTIDYPAEPTYETTDVNGVLSQAYTAKSDDCYVSVIVDNVILGLEDENPHDYAANLTYIFLNDILNTSVTENDIERGTFDGYPAGYITLGDQEAKSFVFASTILGDDYVLYLYVNADTKDRLNETMNSFSLKLPKQEDATE